ncbi:ParB/RepB/Spo0J family partition protein [Sinorhizobium medicae]|uniref:ParB/RepB/Spo0J family partition protein n=3 Tax=Sinorhizobium TaxID=28105 RepID=UPI001AAE9448|nr:ParB/RepB/Spo0J family partition protein [Sinorhizobium medicae]MBO1965256.1 ParB/RepB/Spo0J family partition protein [Sinorhizobium medicae]WQO56859.1 ParB/RepB/Spo0J family partition protein [Sinorhizobium medicae]WQP41215.1 ParB/RepB/Spo0J family partition protein [Sinorhizobium medicae]
MTDIITVALSKLDADPRNVRKTYSAEGIEALAANIRADGYRLLQNLVIRKGDKRGRYFVVAGGRRLAALKLLAEAGEITKDYPVECKEREGEIATEISLAENVMREDMHPVDQYEAFDALAKQGKDIADIAARFGTTETIVRKRLALARVSPILLQQFRDEDMSFAQLSAFTVSDDHERQVTVWNSLPSWSRDPHSIRRALTEEMIPATDKRIQFIGGLEAYEEAGGQVQRELFDDRNAGYAMDVALVEKLVAEKLETAAATVRAEGWKWVECSATAPAGYHAMKRHYPEALPLSEEDQAALDAAQAEYDELAELMESGMADDEAEARLSDVEKRIDTLNARSEAYSAEALEQAGTFVLLDYYGRLAIERGFVKPGEGEAAGDENEDGEGLPSASGAAKPKARSISHSAALIEDLSAHKTAALRIELANNPDVALVAVVHAMLLRVAYPYNSEQSALQLSLTHERLEPSMKDAESCKGLSAFNDLADSYGHHLPGNPADLFDWLLEQPQDMVLMLLALGAAHSVNAVEKKFTDRKKGIEQANQLGRALKVNMPDWFETTGDSYFKHVNRTTIELSVAEARGSDAELSVRAAAKKSEAVTIADRLVAGSGWIPAPVRLARAEAEREPKSESIAEDEQFPQAAE